jgi:molybdenum cofactor cytidylyltransferase
VPIRVNIAAIILAAGNATRFEDGQKLIADLAGRPLIRHVVDALDQSDVDDIILLTGRDADKIAKAAGCGRWRTIENHDPDRGLSSSLRLGIEAASKTADGALIALGDMPGITTDLINQLVDTFSNSQGSKIVFPMARDGQRGHPVIWPRALFSALKGLSGDAGGKQIFVEHRDLWRPVPCEESGAFADVDTRDDLDTFRGS